ncbi:MAG: DUF21 domain-containing protein, partial [Actinobacteria bacterium]|nr:DUF21 domain-containing protein [Actinomycetota bacterium]
MDIALGLLAVLILVAANAFYVAGEFALVAINRESLEGEAESGDRKAISILGAVRSLSFQLSGAQLGITISSLVLGFIAEPTLARVIDPALEFVGLPESSVHGFSIAIALVLATSFQMVFGELVPKNFAIARPTAVARRTVPALKVNNFLQAPLIRVLNAAANWTVRLFGIEPREEITGVRSLEELDLLVHASREAGTLQDEEYSLLARSIDFGEKTAAEALVPRTSIEALPQTATLKDMTELARSSGHSRFPVYSESIDDIIGVAYVKDLLAIPFERRAGTSITAIVQEPLLVPESRDLESLLVELRRARKQLAIVLDEYGGTAGIVSVEDILEEIVGEIEDEYDPAELTQVTGSLPDGVHLLSGLLHAGE